MGGGFCRYSVDAEWTIPHFEKMLYDNAALLALYADAWRVTGAALFARTARGIVEISAAIRLRRVITNEWWLALSGILSIFVGILLLVRPGAGALAIAIVIGIYAILFGMVLVVFGLRLRRLSHGTAARQPGSAG